MDRINQKSSTDTFFSQDFTTACHHFEISTHFQDLKHAHLFITGGTGFFGCWLLHFLNWLNREAGMDIRATFLTRDETRFLDKYPEFAPYFVSPTSAPPHFQWLRGDVRSFEFPPHLRTTPITHIIHAATEASLQLNQENPLLMLDTITQGTRQVLNFARDIAQGAGPKILYVSSGAIYGKQPLELTHIPETYLGAPDPLSPHSAYGEGKRYAEFLCTAYQIHSGLQISIARCFAFVGPYLPWDIHFAIGNFLRDVTAKKEIQILGDGTPERSYLYGADLAVWLLTLLLHGKAGRAYNVGSEHNLPLAQIAQTVSKVAQDLGLGVDPEHSAVSVAKTPDPRRTPERYIPSTERARSELGLRETFSLEQAIRRSLS